MAGLIETQDTLADEFHDHRVVLGHQIRLIVSNQVQSAVADMATPGMGSPNHQGGTGGSHAILLRILLCGPIDNPVRGLKCRSQRFQNGTGMLIVGIRKNGNGKPAGNVASVMSTHAVGHHGQISLVFGLLPPVRPNKRNTVFIRLADTTRVGGNRRVYFESRCPRIIRSVCGVISVPAKKSDHKSEAVPEFFRSGVYPYSQNA